MNNFLDFINKDIENKKTLLTTLPTKTKTNKKKFNLNIVEIEKKYLDYQTSTKNYILAKAKSLQINDEEKKETTNKIENLEHVKYLLNPSNTYVEKMGFDTLLYQINNYYRFNFKSLNEIINGFLDKFEQAGIDLNSDDFDYTCYVHEYMTSFLEVRNRRLKSYDKVSEIFEQIYWVNPDLIEHIELNFRKLIKKNSRKFNNYISRLQHEAMLKCNVRSYNHCLEKLQATYIDLNMENKESIKEIIDKAINNEFDIEQYMPDSKVREQAYKTLIPADAKMENACIALEKLKINIEEYKNYLTFLPIFQYFKTEYSKLLNKKEEYKGLENIIKEIDEKEKELDKLNKKIFGKTLFKDFNLKQLKLESIQKAKELYELYKKYDDEYFKDKVLKILNNTLTISDVLNLYYSYDYFKKLVIQGVYNINNYEEIIKYSDDFDLFAMNPTNIIITGVNIFEENDIARVIANKYRLSNLNIIEEDLGEDNLNLILNKIMLILRVEKIEKSNISLDKIWFLVQVEKMINKEKEATA